MWKLNLLATLFIGATIPLHAAENKTVLADFEGQSDARWRPTSNAEAVAVTPAKAPASGQKCVKVTLGGLNAKKGGSLQFKVPAALKQATVKKISFWLKGTEDNEFGPVLIINTGKKGYYCWKGPRNHPKVQLDVTDDAWGRYEFNFTDFVKHNDKSGGKDKLNFKDAEYISLALGRAKDYPESITFFVDKVELISDSPNPELRIKNAE